MTARKTWARARTMTRLSACCSRSQRSGSHSARPAHAAGGVEAGGAEAAAAPAAASAGSPAAGCSAAQSGGDAHASESASSSAALRHMPRLQGPAAAPSPGPETAALRPGSLQAPRAASASGARRLHWRRYGHKSIFWHVSADGRCAPRAAPPNLHARSCARAARALFPRPAAALVALPAFSWQAATLGSPALACPALAARRFRGWRLHRRHGHELVAWDRQHGAHVFGRSAWGACGPAVPRSALASRRSPARGQGARAGPPAVRGDGGRAAAAAAVASPSR